MLNKYTVGILGTAKQRAALVNHGSSLFTVGLCIYAQASRMTHSSISPDGTRIGFTAKTPKELISMLTHYLKPSRNSLAPKIVDELPVVSAALISFKDKGLLQSLLLTRKYRDLFNTAVLQPIFYTERRANKDDLVIHIDQFTQNVLENELAIVPQCNARHLVTYLTRVGMLYMLKPRNISSVNNLLQLLLSVTDHKGFR